MTQGYRLVALDASSGRKSGFGNEGGVDLYDGLPRAVPENALIGLNSPTTTVVGNVIVVGAAMSSAAGTRHIVPAAVRGYDVVTGKLLWTFHTVPLPGTFGSETWKGGSLEYASNVGVWAPMSADEALGYVYVPVEAASTDTSGQHRPGDNLFSESLVCLDTRTGKRVWHFQLAHHGLWDYDPRARRRFSSRSGMKGAGSRLWPRSPSRRSRLSSTE